LRRARRGTRSGAGQRVRGALARARNARCGAGGRAARGSLRSRLGRGSGGIPRGQGSQQPGAADLADGARQRMRLAGMPEDLIRALEKRGRPQSRFTLLAPISGVITELMAREGTTVTVGSSIFRIKGLRKVWGNADVAEMLAERVHRGDAVHARTAALPGVVFDGRVAAVLPSVNVATRTLTARVELANPRMELLPGMFVTVQFAPAALAHVLLVPR